MNRILDWLVNRFDWRIPDDLDLAAGQPMEDEEWATEARERLAHLRTVARAWSVVDPTTTPILYQTLRDVPATLRLSEHPEPVRPAALRPHQCPRCRRFSARSWTASDALGDRRGGVCRIHGEWEAA